MKDTIGFEKKKKIKRNKSASYLKTRTMKAKRKSVK